MAYMVDTEGLDEIVQALRDDGRTVVGPVVRDGAIAHHEIESVQELPRGWTEDQDGGRYQLVETGTDELFAFSSPSNSWKRFLYPERTLLIRVRRHDTGLEVEQPDRTVSKLAFFGVRSCDLAALQILDRVFLDPTATDPTYDERRSDVFIVAAGCGHPGNTCFCASMNTGPTPTSGYDLAIRELHEDTRHQFLVEVGSSRGEDLLSRVSHRDATESDLSVAHDIHTAAVARMGRSLNPDDPPLAAAAPDHSRWDDVASRCLACGNCTMVCPTCFCSTTEDSTSLAGDEAERWRVWDSCFTLDFSHLHGGSTRTSTKARFQQWLMHKLVTWHDQFDTSGCVGCGRCITWCPVGIDLTAEIAALAESGSEPISQAGGS